MFRKVTDYDVPVPLQEEVHVVKKTTKKKCFAPCQKVWSKNGKKMVAGLPKGYALKMLKKLSKHCEKMVAGTPVTIFKTFSFEFSTNRKPKVGAAEGRPLYL